MKKRDSKEVLKLIGYVYLGLALLAVIAGLMFNFIPSLSNAMKTVIGEEGMQAFNVNVVLNFILNILFFYLARSVADGKSKGTFFEILLILYGASGISKLFSASGMKAWGVFDIALSLITWYYIYKIKNNSD